MSYLFPAKEIVAIAKEAGHIIMHYYHSSYTLQEKKDCSPVTQADMEANRYIVSQLQQLDRKIPVVSEENPEEENACVNTDGLFWLVDPLDGTKSFIRKTGEFTVNIALIHNKMPIGGCIYIPEKSWCYTTISPKKVQKQEGNDVPILVEVRYAPSDGVVAVASKSHATPETEAFIATLPHVKTFVPASSSLKFCMVAEGKADIYPRLGPTMEWDTAAGHALVLAAGGKVVTKEGKPLTYAKPEWQNPSFFVWGKGLNAQQEHV